MARKLYVVSPDGSNWQVTHAGSVLSRHHTKDVAVQSGRRVAMANQPSQLQIRRANGTIETEWTYGNDPYPPRG